MIVSSSSSSSLLSGFFFTYHWCQLSTNSCSIEIEIQRIPLFVRFVAMHFQLKLLYSFDELVANSKRCFLFALFFQVEIEGLTGDIRFNNDGRRQNYSLNVVEMSLDQGFVKVAEWSDETEFMPVAAKYMTTYPADHVETNRTYIVTTIIEEPFIMLKKSKSDEPHGREEYEGYCKDLTDLLAKRLGINRKFCISLL